jgi:diguanylate cyclase (GGDEF)-like protein
MSFRNRLTLFFVLIVVVPMVAVAFVLFRLIGDNEQGKADARLATARTLSTNLYQDLKQRARRVAVGVVDVDLAQALRDSDQSALELRARRILEREGAARVVITKRGRVLTDVGDRDAIAPYSLNLLDTEGGPSVGTLQLSMGRATPYVKRVKDLTREENNNFPGFDALVQEGQTVLGSTLASPGGAAAAIPDKDGKTEVTIDQETFTAGTFKDTGFLGRPVYVSVLSPQERITGSTTRSRLLAGGILLGFFVLAFTFAVLVSRSLQRQIDSFLSAARRLGGGDFTATVPTTGRDEFAALGEEFNKMSHQLETRLDELEQERRRLQEAMRRIGTTFASNLNRQRLLEIVVKTAVDGVGADAGRASVRRTADEPLEEVVATERINGVSAAIRAAEHEVLLGGHPVELTLDNVTALAHPLHEESGAGAVSGVVAVGREGRRFDANEQELFHYLAAQAAVSIANVGLHETVGRQAVTDELTGLSNRRRFEEALESEVERFRRFGQPVGLVLLDIDDFKLVNDTHGHQQGDIVLREVARVLRETSREVDEPARYGGEELAVVLPGTDLEGAVNLAERVRRGIEELAVHTGVNGALRVTASLGVATLPGAGYDARSLVEAADDALYRAKRLGKNRTERNA